MLKGQDQEEADRLSTLSKTLKPSSKPGSLQASSFQATFLWIPVARIQQSDSC